MAYGWRRGGWGEPAVGPALGLEGAPSVICPLGSDQDGSMDTAEEDTTREEGFIPEEGIIPGSVLDSLGCRDGGGLTHPIRQDIEVPGIRHQIGRDTV